MGRCLGKEAFMGHINDQGSQRVSKALFFLLLIGAWIVFVSMLFWGPLR